LTDAKEKFVRPTCRRIIPRNSYSQAEVVQDRKGGGKRGTQENENMKHQRRDTRGRDEGWPSIRASRLEDAMLASIGTDERLAIRRACSSARRWSLTRFDRVGGCNGRNKREYVAMFHVTPKNSAHQSVRKSREFING